MLTVKVDHVTIAASQLGRLRKSFAEVGLHTEYGGSHSNKITHMALLGFDDGSYIELISKIEPGEESPWWNQHIVQDGGPCAWAVQVDEIHRETERITALGIPVRGPYYYHRNRPDGSLVEWDLALLGDYEPGAKLPFLIADRTPRTLRVQPSSSVSGSELIGIRNVILGVRDLSAASDLFVRIFGWSSPEVEDDPEFGAYLAAFAGQPVILAQPKGDNWLQDRLNIFGECPCAFLIGSRNLEADVRRRRLIGYRLWFHQDVAWFNPDKLDGTRLGVIAL